MFNEHLSETRCASMATERRMGRSYQLSQTVFVMSLHENDFEPRCTAQVRASTAQAPAFGKESRTAHLFFFCWSPNMSGRPPVCEVFNICEAAFDTVLVELFVSESALAALA